MTAIIKDGGELETVQSRIILTAKRAIAEKDGPQAAPHLVYWNFTDAKNHRLIASVHLSEFPHGEGGTYDVWVCCDLERKEYWSI